VGRQYGTLEAYGKRWFCTVGVFAYIAAVVAFAKLPPTYAPLSDKNILYEIGTNSMRLRLFLFYYFVELFWLIKIVYKPDSASKSLAVVWFLPNEWMRILTVGLKH
jgi:hypothetical protein